MAVINRTEFLKRIRWIQGIVFLIILCGVAGAGVDPQRCKNVEAEFRNRGFATAAFSNGTLYGAVCGENSCCSSQFEKSLLPESRNHTERFVKNSLSKLLSLFETRAKRFDDFFRDMMLKSKREFHDMFKKTYGVIYLQNSYVFTDFFDELERYYSKGKVRLAEMMDTFFAILYQRMFVVINSQYQFNDTYLGCVAEHMAEMKPFGDVPHKLGVQLRRSFVATRTFYLALQKGAAVAQSMMALRLEEECFKELVPMRYCGICRGESSPGPCLSYCVNTLQTCLRHYATLNHHWDNYIDALDKVADRLLGPFNIEMVVEPMNIKISEAIMNFQESGAEVSQRIFTGCGKPKLGRRRRATTETKTTTERKPNDEISYESLNFSNKKKHKKIDNVPSLEKFIKEIKIKVKETRQFWMHLPYQFCNLENVTVNSNPNESCWNGTTDNFRASVKPNGLTPPVIQEQLYTLQVMTGKLQGAYQGQDVDLADDDTEEPLEGSGSGSGDGFEEEHSSGDGGGYEVTYETPIVTQPPTPSTTRPPDKTRKTAASSADSISLVRALAHYLLPIVLVWFGGAISDLL